MWLWSNFLIQNLSFVGLKWHDTHVRHPNDWYWFVLIGSLLEHGHSRDEYPTTRDIGTLCRSSLIWYEDRNIRIEVSCQHEMKAIPNWDICQGNRRHMHIRVSSFGEYMIWGIDRAFEGCSRIYWWWEERRYPPIHIVLDDNNFYKLYIHITLWGMARTYVVQCYTHNA